MTQSRSAKTWHNFYSNATKLQATCQLMCIILLNMLGVSIVTLNRGTYKYQKQLYSLLEKIKSKQT